MAQRDPEMRVSLVEIIGDQTVGLGGIAAAADVIAADARFNLWLAQRGKNQDGNRNLEVLDRYEDAFQACHSAIRKFRQDSDRSEFTNALEAVAKSLVTMTGT
jgi:hypothetical protein